jgi:hypothetical protein
LKTGAQDAATTDRTSAVTAASVSVPSALASAPLVAPTDLVYQGAFRLPAGKFGGSSFDYGGAALAFNPARGSLFMVGHDWQQQVAEVTIPPVSPALTELNSLPTAGVIQPFADATEGLMGSITADARDNVKVGGLLPYQGKLYLSAYVYYDGNGWQTHSHFVSGTDLSVLGDVRGPYQLGTLGAGFVSGYFGLIPAEWQGALGGPVLNGHCCLSIISRTSYGPAVFAIDPTRLGTVDPLPITPLVYYPNEHETLGPWGVQSTVFNGTTTVSGVVFPEGTRSVLFFGRQGLGQWGYGTGTNNPSLAGGPTDDGGIFVYDPTELAKGGHAYPYAYYVWAYDAADLAAVKSGARQPWEVTPYAIWTMKLPFANGAGMILGAAYDPQSGRIFVSQEYGDGANPLIHVFTVGSGSPIVPSPPTVSLVSPNSGATFLSQGRVNLTAAASDRDGLVMSVNFYANGNLVGTATDSPYAINWSAGAAGTYQLSAIATDNAGNSSSSNVTTVFVTAPSSPPTISLVSPSDGAAFAPAARIRIAATANDSDGVVRSVAFYANGALIGTATSSPYVLDWSSTRVGTYRVFALATDNAGNTATSGAASVVIRPD